MSGLAVRLVWAVACVLVYVAGGIAHRRRVARRPVDRDLLGRLGPLDRAFVLGGPWRVKAAVVAGVIDRGQARVAGNRLEPTGEAPPVDASPEANPLAELALQELGTRRYAPWDNGTVLPHLSDDLRRLVATTPSERSQGRQVALRSVPLLCLFTYWAWVDQGRASSIVFIGLAFLAAVGVVAELGSDHTVDARRRLVAQHVTPTEAEETEPVEERVARHGLAALPRRNEQACSAVLCSGSG